MNGNADLRLAEERDVRDSFRGITIPTPSIARWSESGLDNARPFVPPVLEMITKILFPCCINQQRKEVPARIGMLRASDNSNRGIVDSRNVSFSHSLALSDPLLQARKSDVTKKRSVHLIQRLFQPITSCLYLLDCP